MQSLAETQRITSPEGAEIPAFVPIHNLFVLVHPLAEELGTEVVYGNKVKKARKEFFDHALSCFTPQSQNDVLVLIPNVKPTLHDLRINVLKTESMMELFHDEYSWVTLHDRFKRTGALAHRNLLLGNNVPEPSIPASKLEERLESHGFSISSETTIILGGELAPNCVLDAIKDFLTLPQVSSVLLDLRVILGIADYASRELFKAEETFITFADRMDIYYKVMPEGTHYLRILASPADEVETKES